MKRRFFSFLSLEYIFSIAIALSLAYSFWFFFKYQYFPQPFFYDIGDTWMDWFNPAYWAHQPGAYDTYATIYPPLTYVILRAVTYGPCYVGYHGGLARECDWLGVTALHLFYVLAVFLTARTFWKIDRRTAVPRTIAVAIGLPMIWTVDRGNVILITYIFVLLAYGPLLKSARLRWLYAGLAVNMKIYLIGTIAAQLLHRRWRWFEGAMIACVLVYCVSYALFGSGSPAEIYGNITAFADALVINNPLDIWMASSLLPLLQLTRSEIFPTIIYVGSDNVRLIEILAPLFMYSAQITIVAAAAACFYRPEAVPRYRMLTLSIGIALLSTEVSAYTQILILLFCFMEPSKGFLRRYAIIICYIICIPLDYNIDKLPPVFKESFFFKTTIPVEYMVQIGPFIRPVLTLSIPVALAILTIINVWQDIRQQGWAGRWRFRGDVQILPWLRRPKSPASPPAPPA